jgi:hypothetical protein
LKPGQVHELLDKGICADKRGSLVQDIYEIGDIQDVYFFPSFGRRHGFGEPDVIVVTEKYIFLMEVEIETKLGDIFKKIKKFTCSESEDDFDAYKRTPLRQLERFYSIALALKNNNIVDQSGRETPNPQRYLMGAFLLDPAISGEKVIRACSLKGRPYISHLAKELQSRCPVVTLLTINYSNSGNGWTNNEIFHKSLKLMFERAGYSWGGNTAQKQIRENHSRLKKLSQAGRNKINAYIKKFPNFGERNVFLQQFTRIYTGQNFSTDLRDDIDDAIEKAII